MKRHRVVVPRCDSVCKEEAEMRAMLSERTDKQVKVIGKEIKLLREEILALLDRQSSLVGKVFDLAGIISEERGDRIQDEKAEE